MKAAVVYSTITGNTRRVAEAIHTALPPEVALYLADQAPDPACFDLLLIGFWVDKGQADASMRAYLERIANRKVAFFFTLGDYPEGAQASALAARTEALLLGNGNQVLGHFRCQGKVDPELVIRMMNMLPPDHPHAQMTPERQARLTEAARHPNEEDFDKARAFAGTVWRQAGKD